MSNAPAREKKRAVMTDVIIQLMIMGALAMGLYSVAANWFSTNNHNTEVSGYLNALEDTSEEELSAALEQAYLYNQMMPQGPLRDPYSEPDQSFEDSDAYEVYENLMRVNPSETIGRIRYPDLGMSLPLYHGTDDEVLRKGVGHLYGSSLPIGGPSTHSVLTAHSGLVHADLFTPLLKAEFGQVFSVEVLGETHWYQVDSIETVLPTETESLRIEPGNDLVTLVTCTPLSVNTHRLLVRGERIDPPEIQFDGSIAGDNLEPGFPWWVVLIVGGSGLSAWYLIASTKKRRDREQERQEPTTIEA